VLCIEVHADQHWKANALTRSNKTTGGNYKVTKQYNKKNFWNCF